MSEVSFFITTALAQRPLGSPLTDKGQPLTSREGQGQPEVRSVVWDQCRRRLFKGFFPQLCGKKQLGY